MTQKQQKKKKPLIFCVSYRDLYFSFWDVLETRSVWLVYLPLSLSLSLALTPTAACERALSPSSRPRVSLPRGRRCRPGNVSFHHPSSAQSWVRGRKSATGGGFEGVEVGGWWWCWGASVSQNTKKELVRAPVSNGPGTLDYICRKIAINADSSGVPRGSGGSPSVRLP